MTTTNTPTETPDVRELSAAETADVGGGAISLGAYIRRMIWQIQNAPSNATLVGCTSDMDTCAWQQK